MQTSLLRCTLLSAAIAGVLGSPAYADNWDGSYIANGQCYCIGVQDSAVSNQLVPTPIGGQSVSQICERIGKGPGLSKIDGVFDNPVYADPQCGNGPFAANEKPDLGCSGAYEPGVDCQATGPTWNLQAAFSEELSAETEEPAIVSVTGGSRYIDPSSFRVDESTDQETANAPTNDEQVLTAESSEEAGTPNVTSSDEKVLVIDGVEVTVSEDQAQPQAVVTAEAVEVDNAEAARLDAEAKLAEQARIDAEAKQAEQARIDAEAKQVEQARIDAEAKQVEQARIDAEAKQVEQARIDAEAKLAEQARVDAEAKLAEKAAVSDDADAAEVIAESTDGESNMAPIAALQLPTGIESKYNDFEYLQAMPLGYDYGGGGMAVSGSYASHGKWHYLGRASVADSYSELFLGAGYYLVPPNATRMTVSATAGLEYGRFTLTSGDLSTRDDDSGLALSIASRFVLNRHVELQAGLGYSSFFDGDVHFLGGGFVRINKQLDLTSQFELGDNDSFGLGIRYYY